MTTVALPLPVATDADGDWKRQGWLAFDVSAKVADTVPHGPITVTYGVGPGGAAACGERMVCLMRRRLRNARVRLFLQKVVSR